MTVLALASLVVWPTANAQNATPAPRRPPVCGSEAGRQAAIVGGEVDRGKLFSASTLGGWILRLAPDSGGWFLEVSMKGREADDLSRLTPPWHGPNPREIEGWHFRNADNTGPNDGVVNAPRELREFIFSPDVGREIDYSGSETTAADVTKVASFGRGWLHLDDYRLTPPRRGGRAAFEWLRFSACLTWSAASSDKRSN
jgi:hypothetical protein